MDKSFFDNYLNYDPETGVFTWKIHRKNTIRENSIAGTISEKGYIKININGKVYRAHRIAMILSNFVLEPSHQVDHINGIRHDNRLKNLRIATAHQNQQNRKISKTNTVGYKGVTLDKSRKMYKALIQVNGKQLNLGRYSTPEEAHAAYQQAAILHFGEFARY